MNDAERAAAAAKRLFDEHREGERFTGLPADLGPRNLEEAHAIQDCLQRLNEEHGLGPLAGWKVALTTPVMQRLAGIGHPCAGGIHEAFVYRSPAALNAGDYVRIGVEAEIAVRLSADLAGGGHTRDSVAAAVGALAPAIEIVDDRACDYDELDGGLADRGRGLRAGDVVMTGSMVATKWPSAGDEIVVAVDGLGETLLRLA